MSKLRAPFPYFGGKRLVASRVWELLGDPGHYIEPFAGSAAVFLARPETDGFKMETLNDADGWVVNLWRALQHDPEKVASYCVGPVTEPDLHARNYWLNSRQGPGLVDWLAGDPEHHDPKAAAWWLYTVAAAIGSIHSSGGWVVEDGFMVKGEGTGITRGKPYTAHPGRGIHAMGMRGDGAIADHRKRLTERFLGLSDRLSGTRILCGDWKRAVTESTMFTLKNRPPGVFLDPPYLVSSAFYFASDDVTDLHTEIREWCLEYGDRVSIVLCGYEEEHDELLENGWGTELGRGKRKLYGRKTARQETLWTSPATKMNQNRRIQW